MSDLTWYDRAACRGADSDLFFVGEEDRGPGVRDRKEARALRFCDACPVTGECLDAALEVGDWAHGVRGGMTAEERRTEHRRRLRRKQAVPS